MPKKPTRLLSSTINPTDHEKKHKVKERRFTARFLVTQNPGEEPIPMEKTILAPNRLAAWKSAQRMTENPNNFKNAALVRIPEKNITEF